MFAVFVDHADFAGANAIVDADKRLGRTFVECDGTSSDGLGRPDPNRSGILSKARERTLSIALVGCCARRQRRGLGHVFENSFRAGRLSIGILFWAEGNGLQRAVGGKPGHPSAQKLICGERA